MRTLLITAGLAVAACLASASPAAGCSIPVFRYALEHWQPEPYRVFVFHKGELVPEQHRLVESLTPRNAEQRTIANVTVRFINVSDSLDEAARPLWEKHQTEQLPWVVVQQPSRGVEVGAEVWSGALTPENVSRLTVSPLRTTIAQQLIAGESAVWVLLESGNPEQDDAAWKTLTTELVRLEQTLELPPIDPADAAELTVTPESLKLSFTPHRLSRTDPHEKLLAEMLLSVEPDMREAPWSGQPMAFPLFGRGCALYTLVGQGINAATIEEACRFLVGGCQCTVKQQNPGVDLLMTFDWALHVEPTVPLKTTLPPLVGLQGFGDDPLDSPLVAAAVPAESADRAGDPPARANDAEEQGSSTPVIVSSEPATSPRPLNGLTISLIVIVGAVVGGTVACFTTFRGERHP